MFSREYINAHSPSRADGVDLKTETYYRRLLLRVPAGPGHAAARVRASLSHCPSVLQSVWFVLRILRAQVLQAVPESSFFKRLLPCSR